MSTESRGAVPGELTCITENCSNAGTPVAATVCPSCYRQTYAVPAPRGAGAAPMVRPVAGPSAGDIIGRAIFGGFWSIVAVVAFIASGADVSHGKVGAALLALVVAVLCGLYARYIFRGGRFRILFW
jgi:hypothetical protein